MKTNNSPINETDPSYIIIEQILARSEDYNRIMDSAVSLKEKLEHTQDNESRLKLNDEIKLKILQMSKLKECTSHILETFRTIPRCSERLQQAKAYFYQGKFREMDEVLDDSKIREEIDDLEENRFSKDKDLHEKAHIQLEYKSYELVVKALYRYTFVDNPEWYNDVYNLLSDADDISTNFHAMYEFGSYLMLTEEQKWAEERLSDAYVVSRDTEGEAGRIYEAKSLRNLGILSKKENDLSAAIEYAAKALKIYTGLSESNPTEYRPEMSYMLIVLGNYHTLSENFSVATVIFEEATEIMRELVMRHGNWEYSMQLANALDKLGCIYVYRKEYPDAISQYEEALKIMNDNIDYNLYQILESKAKTLYNMTVACVAMQDYEKGIRIAKEELDIRKQIQDVDPVGQLPYKARTRNVLADIYLYLKRPADAVRERENVVKLNKILVEHYQDECLPNLGEAIIQCSDLYFHMKSYDKYVYAVTEAMKIFRKLVATDQETYLPTVIYLLKNLCIFYETISPNGEKALEIAMEIHQILSSGERDEKYEVIYTEVKRVIEKFRKNPPDTDH
jgi:tetratricopeptide (TPR) repeat protein